MGGFARLLAALLFLEREASTRMYTKLEILFLIICVT